MSDGNKCLLWSFLFVLYVVCTIAVIELLSPLIGLAMCCLAGVIMLLTGFALGMGNKRGEDDG